MQGLIAEGQHKIEARQGDASLLGLAQRIEHYEIAGYGTLRSWASLLEEDDAAEALGDILEEEKAADERLTELAESTINIEAAEQEMEAEESDEEKPRPRRVE
jgi:ferritin-like metal-binding protein YciE